MGLTANEILFIIPPPDGGRHDRPPDETIKGLLYDIARLQAQNAALKRADDEYESLCESHKRLEATNKRLREALEECRDWFAERHDADCDQDGFIPNEEMKMTAMIDHIMGWSY